MQCLQEEQHALKLLYFEQNFGNSITEVSFDSYSRGILQYRRKSFYVRQLKATLLEIFEFGREGKYNESMAHSTGDWSYLFHSENYNVISEVLSNREKRTSSEGKFFKLACLSF